MTSTDRAVDIADLPRIAHREAMTITATENARLLAQLHDVDEAGWAAPSDCSGWTVRDIAVHLIAAAQAQASPLEFARQVRAGRPLTAEIGGSHWVDGLNEAQLRARADWRTSDLPARWARHSARALAARRRMPRPLRALRVLPLGEALGVDLGRQPLGYLFDIGFTRDVWMHRVDIARATGQRLELTAAHDGRIVADIVAEWADLHREPFTLQLDGPAGGRFIARGGATAVRIDAIEFVRILSGRADGTGVLRHKLPL